MNYLLSVFFLFDFCWLGFFLKLLFSFWSVTSRTESGPDEVSSSWRCMKEKLIWIRIETDCFYLCWINKSLTDSWIICWSVRFGLCFPSLKVSVQEKEMRICCQHSQSVSVTGCLFIISEAHPAQHQLVSTLNHLFLKGSSIQTLLFKIRAYSISALLLPSL